MITVHSLTENSDLCGENVHNGKRKQFIRSLRTAIYVAKMCIMVNVHSLTENSDLCGENVHNGKRISLPLHLYMYVLKRLYRHSPPPQSPVSDFLHVDTRYYIYNFHFPILNMSIDTVDRHVTQSV